MIKEIEALMVHWGEQMRERGQGGGLGSQMGAIIEWGGAPPRGTPGSRVLGGAGGGIDHIASEVQAAVAELERSGRAPLARLALERYCAMTTIREQMKAVGIAEGADRTYRNWVDRLHQQVLLILTLRSGSTRGYPVGLQTNRHLKVATGVSKAIGIPRAL
ncbi:hypothetical protein GSU75_03479 [Pseudomonas savastanoi pv. phaseolicola]|uniref:Uncharacterized protein n=3 Tax=Pseudomonas syringae group genomosp. 2 TaxID=251698 RepID=A0A3M3G7X6_PSESG|nr:MULTISPECIES: hypothetical protein [Pseudomonas syringae group genomosp. 2]MBN4176230.1 hypothetical protein [Pseudomonas savastanoi pv. phaseolicola]KWS75616.1 hypothetical protein AL052_07075 [Pseudomonas amygdali pv. eriobotryae]RMM00616.1 hypothetical protein ALQ86_02627 [Pseudomonas amygdali pv. eriobotryae]RMM69584.1 hypothetical protein ALQ73_02770 [Pseudomonas savastanoi pv. glycinea]GFZ69498.1 hypothetical protein PSE10C_02400 [Pseudomonas amygdali pv. eriobotryae]